MNALAPPAARPKAGGSGSSRHRALATVEAERQRLHEVLMASPAAIAIVRGPDHVYELANPQYLRLLGHREVLGRPVREAVPELVVQGFVELLDRVYATGEPFTGTEVPIQLDRRGDGTWETMYFNFVYQPTRDADGAVDGIVIHAVEVTELLQARRRAEALAGAADAFARAEFDLPALLDAIVHRVTAAIGDVGLLKLLRPDGETLGLDAVSSLDAQQQARVRKLLEVSPGRVGEGISGRVVQTGEAVRIAELGQEAHDAALPPALQAALGHVTIHSVLSVPLHTGGRVMGALTLYRSRPGHPYTEADQALLQDLADRAALAVDNARLYEAERAARATAEAALATARRAA
ncbi:MAG: GAF domain-containing protein, partial [Chloroflexota bacterium]|nr:GAF domain-containing protein [Chloroflexota bacterium]